MVRLAAPVAEEVECMLDPIEIPFIKLEYVRVTNCDTIWHIIHMYQIPKNLGELGEEEVLSETPLRAL
ncbi:hypothetical protein VNO77_40690 [Canavalia gladiata]|uniref:Uncharacterized protein n=1 Tax=Canavalia gladiata TaxID=3824 RepID=A0AAN9JY63_CANGL